MSQLEVVKISTLQIDKFKVQEYQALPLKLYNQPFNEPKSQDVIEKENTVLEILTFYKTKCEDKRKWFDTTENIDDIDQVNYICHEKSNGTKSILVIGNSHAAVLFNGIRYHFQDVYSNLVLVSLTYCMPFLSEFEVKRRDGCIAHEKRLRKMISTSYTRYDIIILAIQYNAFANIPVVVDDVKNDLYYQKIQDFADFLNEHTNELVMLPRVHVQFPDNNLYFTVQRHLFTNRDFSSAIIDQKPVDDLFKNLQKRLKAVKCSKCMFVNWKNAVCDSEKCYAVNERSKNMIFYDYTHINVLGSLYYGKMVRNMYDEFLVTGNLQIEDHYKQQKTPFSIF